MKALSAPRTFLTVMSFLAASFLALPLCAAAPNFADWIWSAAQKKDAIPAGSCYFRKSFQMGFPESAKIEITADDAYELYINGRHVGSGNNWKRLDTYDITQYLINGRNVVAIKATNEDGESAGIVARIVVKEKGGTYVAYPTDESWKASLKESPRWNRPTVDDGQWVNVQSFGALGATLPWGDETQVAGEARRFQVMPGFKVDWVIAPEKTGSLVAMTFNEFGQIVASQENGPLLLITDANRDGTHDTASIYCDQVKNCQGLLALNGKIYALGHGPEDTALYELSDLDRNSRVDRVTALVHFEGPMREHGPHALTLGPDGMIYMVVGNHSKQVESAADSSPLRDSYEGDLITPRYEDPGGHAAGVKAPGGTILRTDIQGKRVEVFAGGLRNPYDIAFNRQGDLFTFDSDMESNLALPWYRPTRIYHALPGADFGWRSGWAKWPDYFLDGLPSALELGQGSPTGITFYNHFQYPTRFHNALFACDWARGRIHVVRLQENGGSYNAESEVFVEGRPLNVTDIAVGPNGALYFCTGGRDTEGGIYSVHWSGQVPPAVSDLGQGIERAIRYPQLDSAWARQEIAKIKQSLGTQWGSELLAYARDERNRPGLRMRAIDLMQLFGPLPQLSLLTELSHDADPIIRAKATNLMGAFPNEAAAERLTELLVDRHPAVRRRACFALLRTGQPVSAEKAIDLLADPDRHIAFGARRLLERLPNDDWKDTILEDQRTRVFLHGSTALLAAHPNEETAKEILDRCGRMIQGEVSDPGFPRGFISDQQFTELLRVMQLALVRGELTSEQVPDLGPILAAEYPSRDAIMNRELVRLLAYLQEGSVTELMIGQLKSNIPDLEKLQIAAMAPFLKRGWTTKQKLELLSFYESARAMKGGNAFARFIENFSRDFFVNLDEDERGVVLTNGAKWPSSALSVLARLPANPGEETLNQIIQLDKELAGLEGDVIERLRLGIVAVLGRSQDAGSMTYLREVYEKEPARRDMVAMGLAQSPDGDNWPLLVRSLATAEGVSAREVLSKLSTVDHQPETPEALRQAILCGLRLKENGAEDAIRLLRHWTGEDLASPDDSWETALAAWQQWFSAAYPDSPKAELPVDSEHNKWTYDELLTYLHGEEAKQGNRLQGESVFAQAQCNKCHRFGSQGESIGPDLTSVGRRFQTKEILQAIVFPSHVISDQYASKSILTKGGRTYTGIVAPDGQDSLVVLQSNGEKVTLPRDDVEQINPNSKSAMPEGLLNTLTLQQVADLFAYLKQQPRANVSSRRGETQR